MNAKSFAALPLLGLVYACSSVPAADIAAAPPAKIEPAPEIIKAQTWAGETESERLNTFFEEDFMAAVMRSPISQTYMGIRGEDYGKWDDVSSARAIENFEIAKARHKLMNDHFDYDALTDDAKLSFDLYNYQFEQQAQAFEWRDYGYTFNQMFGQQSSIPAFLISQHSVSNLAEAEAYISRLNGVKDYLGTHIENAKRSAANGVRPPEFVYDYVIRDAENVLTGYPFSETEGMTDSPIMGDIRGKLDSLKEKGELSDEAYEARLLEAEEALLTSFLPAYESLISFLETDKLRANSDDGVWKLPNGEAYYAFKLYEQTTTTLTAQEIHDIGLREVARIHDEMRTIMRQVEFDGSLQDFFEYTRTDASFFKPNTDEGRAEYLAEATEYIDEMRALLPSLFNVLPKAKLEIKRVEPFREKSAGKAFYSPPAPDGSRPGVYYANLYDMSAMPVYQMEALAFHEALPGHHLQLSIAQELEDVPKFRKFNYHIGYIEGWGLYSEYFPKEYGFYKDPYSDYGRLAMELWRAARLVVDTGLHELKWTREEATQYLIENTPNPASDAQKAIDRYIVMPGQATAYMVGLIKMLELRQHAKNELGSAFDIRAYHDVILKNGSVPLAVLEALVNDWIAETKAKAA